MWTVDAAKTEITRVLLDVVGRTLVKAELAQALTSIKLGSDTMPQALAISLDTLHSHTIFVPASASSSSQDAEEDWQLVSGIDDEEDESEEEELRVPQKTGKMVMRDNDLIVAMGKEVRVAKTGGDAWTVKEGKVGNYKVSHG